MSFTANDAWLEIKNELGDVSGVSTFKECSYYLNRAIDYLSMKLAKDDYQDHVTEASITNGSDVPDNFYSLLGVYPIKQTDSKFIFLSGAPDTMIIRYSFVQSHISESSDTIPFQDRFRGVFVAIATLFAQNKNEQNISQDTQITTMLLEAVG